MLKLKDLYFSLLTLSIGILMTTSAAAKLTPPSKTTRGFKIDFHTGPLPPPYNYRYELSATCDEQHKTIQVDYVLHYSDLEAQKTEDLKYHKTLSGNWYTECLDLWQTTTFSPPRSPSPPLLGADHFIVELWQAGATKSGKPQNRAAWQRFAEDLRLAAKEEVKGQKVPPLQYALLSSIKGSSKLTTQLCALEYQAVKREILATLTLGEGQHFSKPLPLEQYRELQKILDKCTYHLRRHLPTLPDTPGSYLNRDGQTWLAFVGEDIQDGYGLDGAKKELLHYFQSLIQELSPP